MKHRPFLTAALMLLAIQAHAAPPRAESRTEVGAGATALSRYALIQPEHLPSPLHAMQGRGQELGLDEAQKQELLRLIIELRTAQTPLLTEARALETEIAAAALSGQTRQALAPRLDRLQRVKREATEAQIDNIDHLKQTLTATQYEQLLRIADTDRATADATTRLQGSEKATATQLRLIDAGRYEESWAVAADVFRQQVARDEWSRIARTARDPLGTVKDRKLRSLTYATTLPGLPDGDYAVFVYDSDFAQRSKVAETIAATRGTDGAWRLSGYFIK